MTIARADNTFCVVHGGNMAEVEFETIKADEVKFGRNNFLEIARKRAVTEEGKNEFIAISRGFFLPDGTKRFRRSLAVPDDSEIINFIVNKLKEYHSDAPKAPKKAAKSEEKMEEELEETTEEQ